jgi:cardiolipin synthase
MHHKVLVVDDDLAAVGTANFDNRSIRLNFELMLIFADRSFAAEVSTMLENDFKNCRQATTADIAGRTIWFHFAVRLARLMAPNL